MSANRNTRVLSAAVLWSGLAVAALSASGCASASRALGIAKVTPDEFRVVTKAPLVVPPDYALRPPAPGEPRPQELAPESQARLALLGEREQANRDEGEKLFVDKAGAQKADPLIRYVVDDEFGDLAHKDRSFADRVMFWRKGEKNIQVAQAEAAANTPAALDPQAAEAKVKSLTGGGQVVIQRAPAKKRFKLPGL